MAANPETLPVRQYALATLAERFGVKADALFLSSLKSVAFKAPNASNEQLLALCVTANQYGLNPFTKELYAFPDKGGGIVPIVSVDGWSRILNDSPQFDGLDFVEAEDGSWIECVIYRKDRAHPIKAREYMAECRRDTAPWKSHPRRMLRHKAMIQAARMAFGFSGIYDPDEGERIVAVERPAAPAGATQTERVKALLTEPSPAPEPADPGVTDGEWLEAAGLGDGEAA
jgi:phage recombination protein Bet